MKPGRWVEGRTDWLCACETVPVNAADVPACSVCETRRPDDAPSAEAVEVARLTALLNSPEVEGFARGVVLEAAHQRQRWDDSGKTDFDWAAVAHYLLAKCHLNPAQNDGTVGERARLHRLVALGALCANWHRAVLQRGDAALSTPPSAGRDDV